MRIEREMVWRGVSHGCYAAPDALHPAGNAAAPANGSARAHRCVIPSDVAVEALPFQSVLSGLSCCREAPPRCRKSAPIAIAQAT